MAPRSDRLWIAFGLQVRDARLAKSWTVRELSERAGVSTGMVYRIESGAAASTELAGRVATALGRRAELQLVDPRQRDRRLNLAVDPVHSAMAEFEARRFRSLGFQVGVDEPYQHYQFAGRADLVAWDLEAQALLHIENRTRFPDFQEMAGAYNAKRAYLGIALAGRLGVGKWRTEAHIIAALWSSEVTHALRLRPESFRSLCPDPPLAFGGWWEGQHRAPGTSSSLVILDPLAAGRQRSYVGLDEALAGVRPRYRGYREAAEALASSG